MPVTLHDLIYELPNSEALGREKGRSWDQRRNRDEHPRRVSPGTTVVSGSRYSWAPLHLCSSFGLVAQLCPWIYEPNIPSFIQVNVNLVSVTSNQFVLTTIEPLFSSHWASHPPECPHWQMTKGPCQAPMGHLEAWLRTDTSTMKSTAGGSARRADKRGNTIWPGTSDGAWGVLLYLGPRRAPGKKSTLPHSGGWGRRSVQEQITRMLLEGWDYSF